ncbi:hypothetical protein WMO40_19330 [Bacillaceae bacterium CLA-AA-H227]|uniref:Uncharacterized protein n=1 Tax=Robertmurraya yapensis (ex Hitch et al 2024) TaxID=3133160 RepID=A0ACC6SG77_9BACI|nr:hypothetical protein [Bacillus yapensis]
MARRVVETYAVSFDQEKLQDLSVYKEYELKIDVWQRIFIPLYGVYFIID